MDRIIWIVAVLLVFPVCEAFGLAFTDVPAQAQRLALLAEEKIQSLKMIVMAKDMYNNYVTARQTYELAKAGIERSTNPEEWKALEEYSRMRLSSLAEADPNPYSSSLYRNLVALDRVADEYILNTQAYKKIQDSLMKSGQSVSSVDGKMQGWLMTETLVGNWYGLEEQLNRQADTMAAARTFIATAYDSGEQLGSQVDTLEAEGVKATSELEKLLRLQFYAEQGYALALERLKTQSDKSASAVRASEARLEKAKAILEDVRNRIKDKEEYIRELDGRVGSLKAEVMEHNNNLTMSATAMGIEKIAQHSLSNAGLVRMGEKEPLIDDFQKTGWWLLVVSTMIGLLWRGTAVFRGDEGGVIPKDTIASMIAAFVFLAPGSPIGVKNLAKEGAILVDAMEMSLFKNTQKDLQSQFGQSLSLVSTVDAAALDSSKSASLMAQASAVMASASKPIMATVMQIVFVLSSLIGALATIVVFSVRTVVYWVLMAILPLVFLLLPIPYVRNKMMPTWGTLLFAVILWGPVTKILLTFNNVLGQINESLITGFVSGNALSASMIYGIQGLILLILIVLSPALTFYMANSSFGPLVSGVLSGGAMAMAGLASGGAVAAGAAATGGGGLLMKVGVSMGSSGIGGRVQSAGRLMKSLGETVGRTRLDASRGTLYVQRSPQALPKTGGGHNGSDQPRATRFSKGNGYRLVGKEK